MGDRASGTDAGACSVHEIAGGAAGTSWGYALAVSATGGSGLVATTVEGVMRLAAGRKTSSEWVGASLMSRLRLAASPRTTARSARMERTSSRRPSMASTEALLASRRERKVGCSSMSFAVKPPVALPRPAAARSSASFLRWAVVYSDLSAVVEMWSSMRADIAPVFASRRLIPAATTSLLPEGADLKADGVVEPVAVAEELAVVASLPLEVAGVGGGRRVSQRVDEGVRRGGTLAAQHWSGQPWSATRRRSARRRLCRWARSQWSSGLPERHGGELG
ncbi:hypothetical protein FB451DRAFT_1298225 [Mycena latifolia]|nr:hypothetical protein FB451DRAFT_1298225 [Mycena latifolia]